MRLSHPSARRLPRATLVASIVLGACDTSAPGDEPHRVGIIGASMSFGYEGWSFGDAWLAAAPSTKITSLADVFFYLDPISNAEYQAQTIGQTDADLIIALDYLFWPATTSIDPLSGVDVGLEAIDAIDDGTRMFVVGDVPRLDTHEARRLSVSEVAAVHAHLEQWAAGRPNIVIVPFSDWTELLLSDANVQLPDGTEVAARSLMNSDGLHPTSLGTWYVLDRVDKLLEGQLSRYPADFATFPRPQ